MELSNFPHLPQSATISTLNSPGAKHKTYFERLQKVNQRRDTMLIDKYEHYQNVTNKLQRQILKSKIKKLFDDNLVKDCHKFGHYKYRQEILAEDKELPKKLEYYKLIQKEVPKVDFDEILCTYLSPNELKQVSEDINYFITNKEIKDKITLFNICINEDKIATKVKMSTKINTEAVMY